MAGDVLEWARPYRETLDHFQVFGERRTGTNFVAQLMSENFTLEQTKKYGWKHGYPTMPCVQKTALFVVVVRSPLAWLSSLHNRPFAKSHEGLGFSEFLRTEWHDQYHPKDLGHTLWGYGGMPKARRVPNQLDRHPITGKAFQNPLEMRSVKNACFLGLLERNCNAVLVDYDMVKDAPDKVLSAISEIYELPMGEAVAVPGHVGAKGRPKERVSDTGIDQRDLEFIRQNLDAEQEERFGFWEPFLKQLPA